MSPRWEVPKFEFYEDEAGEHRWRLVAGNGETVASGEGHKTEADAIRAALRMVAIAEVARDEFLGA